MQHGPIEISQRLTPIQWLICVIAAIGFAFDIYELLMLPLIVRPALLELTGAAPGSPEFQMWVGTAVLRPGVCRRHLRPARRLPHRPPRTPARADLEHPALRVLGLRGRVLRRRFEMLLVLRSLDVHRRVRRVRGGRGLAGRAVPRPSAARRCSATRRRFPRSAGCWWRPQRSGRQLRRMPAGSRQVRRRVQIRMRRGGTR